MPRAGTSPSRSFVPDDAGRLNGAERRESLIDIAARIVVERGVEDVGMETVADEAGVSRALVYKHFANRGEMLTAVYRREAVLLHEEMAAEVRSAQSLEGMFRALIRASFRVSAERGALFAALRTAGAWNRDLRAEQRARDRQTIKAFAAQAAKEYSIPLPQAQRATAMLLGCTDSIMMQWRSRKTSENAAALEQTYLDLVTGGLERVAENERP
jgi:AcrR family transcriptional regulator